MDVKMTLDKYYPGVSVRILEPTGKISKDIVANIGSKNIVLESGRRFGTDIWSKDCFLEKKKAKPGKLFLTSDEIEKYVKRRKKSFELKMLIRQNWDALQDFSAAELSTLIKIIKIASKNREEEMQRGGMK